MSLFCPRVECKAQPGMCKCEKVMSLLVVIGLAYLLFRLFA